MLFHYPHDYNKIEACITVAAFILFVSGYFMNLQNLWEYWPISGQFSDVPMQWIISTVGIFLAPMGAFTGWIL